MNKYALEEQQILNEIIDQIFSSNIAETKIIAEEIYSVKRLVSLEQFLPNICGFYALYNTYFEINHNITLFWKFYFELIKQLNQMFEGDFENFDELQRYHLDYILNNKIIQQLQVYQDFGNKRPKEVIPFFYGCDIIQNSTEELSIISDSFNRLRQQQISNLTLICGITIHYLIIDLRWEQTKLNIYLIDSQNDNLNKLFNKQIVMDKNLSLEKRRRRRYKIDLRNLIMILQRLLIGQDIIDIYLEYAINNVRDSFDEFAQRKQLKEWIIEEYPLPVLKHMIFNVAKQFNKQLKQMSWILEYENQELSELKNQLMTFI
ncbi:unnamed protein product (macronuclear) [Paramecium tetraurelia]|uniref:Uncharacterized protein n=1 Tax=Paramecium tetraurelia TaxID=5888 RepID=A0DZC4_PARTE|nr:uncharacterized protein GSPATT00003360001 [Paramecium tetraurelia]CAK88391.1 unnamed protein product [Paramecium tetraurelia]|eukprot:XP_001455788.1 hypothetical protein (macronuclear) [Paramecium tetraurelia strain d4-2]